MSASSLPFELRGFWTSAAVLFAIILARYFLFAGGLYWLFYKRGLAPLRKIRPEPPAPGMIQKEIGWSILTSAIFALSGAFMLHAWESGRTVLYARVEDYGWTWLGLSLPVLLVLHETYFYWTHRWIHHPWLFRWVHRVHHESHNPTPWAAFSFHPLEAILQAVILPALVWVVPTHFAVLLAFLMIMTVLGVINHLGYEIYPRGAEETALGRELINASHHYLHHNRARCNFGLYFTFWDRWMKTEAPDSGSFYHQVTNRERPRSEPAKAA
jgi:Delta7-sterol 5-desaturase